MEYAPTQIFVVCSDAWLFAYYTLAITEYFIFKRYTQGIRIRLFF